MRLPRIGTWFAAAIILAAGVSGGAAQSLTAMRGLGYPILATDSRSDALGGLGIGLVGMAVPFTNPATAAGVSRRGVVVTAAATDRTTTLGDLSANTGTTRFPLMRVLFPMGRVVITAGYGTFLDQSWAVVRQGSDPLTTGSVSYEDQVSSVGGIGQAQVGASIPLTPRFAVGVAVGSYLGRQDVTIRRQFDTTSVGSYRTFREDRAARYHGAMAQLGFEWAPQNDFRFGASLTWSGKLSADSAGGQVANRQYDLPLRLAAGASAYLSPGLLAAVSGRWSGWSVTEATDGLVESDVGVTSRDTWEIGGGLELDNPERRAVYSFPLRLGFQYRQLPFSFVSDNPSEWMGSLGLGMRVGADFNTPLARIDLTIQRGARSAAGDGTIQDLNETFWRVALGISIFGT